MSDPFVHLHVHSEYSLLDGMGRTGQLARRAAELGQPALALTDHGVMHGAIEFARACKKEGVKPLIGVEAYLTQFGRPMAGRDGELDKERYHLLLLAENMAGYHNLLRLCSDAQFEGYYYKPRIDADYLAGHSEGIICLSGCLAAELPTLINNGQADKAVERLHWYRDVFGPERWYVEFQEHDIPELTQVNRELFAFARQFNVPMVVTNDAHYIYEQDAKPHDILLCVQTSSLASDPKRLRYDGTSFYLKSLDQMRQTFLPLADLPESAFLNTLKVAEMCQVDPEDEAYHFPDIAIPQGFTYQTYLRQLSEEGLRLRYGSRADDPDVRARAEHELRIIHEMGFDVYYLIVWDLCMHAKGRGIWWNVRGSGAGSIVAYAIGVTNLDPLRNKLIFERFLNPGRVTMPDFDLDFPDDQRDELIRYAVEKYGRSQVAQIVTFGRMKARAAVRDVGRALDVPLSDVDRLAKMIPAVPGKPVTIKEVLTEGHDFYSADLAKMYEDPGEAWIKPLLDTASELEGVARHSSIHAAAVVVADRELTHYTPLMRPPKSAVTETVTQYEYPVLESIGLLKIDFLGLATLTLMREATQLIKERHGVTYTLDNLPLDDPKIYELLTTGDVMGVFQVEGQGMRRVLVEMRPTEFDHITATISLYRPGPMEFIPDFIAGLHGEKEPTYVHPILEPILAETQGVCTYQEQVIQILTDVAGYTPGEADLVRRGISKKSKKTLDEHRGIFAEGAGKKSGLSHAESDEIWDALMGFARYGFNRAHAADYAVIVAQTAFLKAYYPVEYMTALLTVERHNTEKAGVIIAECRRMGIEVLPPNVNVSGHYFTIEQLPSHRVPPKQVTTFPFPVEQGIAIRMGLDAVKNVGEGAVDLIRQARRRSGFLCPPASSAAAEAATGPEDAGAERPFASLADFADRVDLRQVNRRGLECLIKVGALDDFGERGQLLAAIDRIMAASQTAHEAREIGQLTLFSPDGDSTDDLLAASRRDGTLLPDASRVSTREALEWEKELVGVYVSSHPLQKMTVDLANLISHSTVNVTEELAGKGVVVAGMVADVRTITTKKGDSMAFVRLEDLQGAVDVTVFPKLFAERRSLWANDKIVIVNGKVDVRNGRVNVVADAARDYVEGMTVVEDTTSVAFRYRNPAAQTAERPVPADRPVPKDKPPPPAPRSETWAPGGDEDEEGDLGDANPFAAEEPEWWEDRNGTFRSKAPCGAPDATMTAPGAAVAPRPAPTERKTFEVSETSKVSSPQTVRIAFRRSASMDADRRRLGELVSMLSGFDGEDRFEITVEANGAVCYQLDFPNNRTRVCRQLQDELTQRLGAAGWRVE